MKGSILAMLLCALIAIPLGGCQGDQTQPNLNLAILKTSVSFREKIMLPPGCKLTLTLKNVSLLNNLDNVIASRAVTVQAAPPFDVLLEYDSSRIDKRLNYTLTADIELKDQLLFTSIERIDPFAVPAGEPIKVMVRKVKR